MPSSVLCRGAGFPHRSRGWQRRDTTPTVWNRRGPCLQNSRGFRRGRFATLSHRLADVSLNALRRKFDANFEGSGQTADLAWFPAWVLTEKPGVARLLREARPSRQTAPERATRLLLQILTLERQGNQHELVERRKALRDLHGGLYAAYMKTR